jgi:metal-responsive CopG/Arc/MetJ family transcriptional regulator
VKWQAGFNVSELKSLQITLRLPPKLLAAADSWAQAAGVSRAEYLRRALQQANREAFRRELAERLGRESLLVRENSMRINAEFAAIEEDLEPPYDWGD